MRETYLPLSAEEVLDLPDEAVPDAIRGLIRRRILSSLVRDIHSEMRAPDPALRARAELALQKLGFPD